MIVYSGKGGLGNQIFQYKFLGKVRYKDERVITSSFIELGELCDTEKTIIIKNKISRFIFNKVVIPFVNIMANMSVFGRIYLEQQKINGVFQETEIIKRKEGLVPITLVLPCYAQHEGLCSDSVKIRIKNDHVIQAENYLSDRFDKNDTIIGVHVRKNDYLTYSVYGIENPSLPDSFFEREISLLINEHRNSKVLVFTDDSELIHRGFWAKLNCIVSKNTLNVDFSLMSMCDYLIISPSTFSQSAAKANMTAKSIIAPKHWLGWKSKLDYPNGFDGSSFVLKEVMSKDED